MSFHADHAIKRCYECPFHTHHEAHGSRCDAIIRKDRTTKEAMLDCTMISEAEAEAEADDVPKWCPLRVGSVLVRLHQDKR